MKMRILSVTLRGVNNFICQFPIDDREIGVGAQNDTVILLITENAKNFAERQIADENASNSGAADGTRKVTPRWNTPTGHDFDFSLWNRSSFEPKCLRRRGDHDGNDRDGIVVKYKRRNEVYTEDRTAGVHRSRELVMSRTARDSKETAGDSRRPL